MNGLINWELLGDMLMPARLDNPGLWDAFAVRYDAFAKLESTYTQLQIEAMQLHPDDTLLDIGAGPGRLSIPASHKVARVTALDSSASMLKILRDNAAKASRNNIDTLNMAWKDIRPDENLERHDVVIASRSPAIRDLVKLDQIARKHVYILLFAGPSLKSIHDELLTGICDSPQPVPQKPHGLSMTAILFNRLCDMGIDASVQYVRDGFTHWYDSKESLYADFCWLNIPDQKMPLFKKNIRRFVSPENNGFRFRRETKTVIVSWTKE